MRAGSVMVMILVVRIVRGCQTATLFLMNAVFAMRTRLITALTVVVAIRTMGFAMYIWMEAHVLAIEIAKKRNHRG